MRAPHAAVITRAHVEERIHGRIVLPGGGTDVLGIRVRVGNSYAQAGCVPPVQGCLQRVVIREAGELAEKDVAVAAVRSEEICRQGASRGRVDARRQRVCSIRHGIDVPGLQHPDRRRVSIWGTDRDHEARFLNVSLETPEVTVPKISPSVQSNLAGNTPRRFVWARSRRYIYFEDLAGETRNVWRLTIDPSTEQLIDGPIRLTTGTGEETNVALSPDGARILFTSSSSRTRLWAFPLDSSTGRMI